MTKEELVELLRECIDLVLMEEELMLTEQEILTIKEQIDECITEDEELLNEAVASMAISIMLSAPKLIEWIGKAVKFIVNQIKKVIGKDTQKENFGDKIIGVGHKLEKFYIKSIKFLLKTTGLAKKAGIKDDKELEKTAKIIFYVILFGAAIAAGYATIDSIGSIISGNAGSTSGVATYGSIKGSLAGIKSSEIIGALTKFKGKIF